MRAGGDIRKYRVDIIVSQTSILTLIEFKTIDEVFFSGIQDLDFHLVLSLIFSLARSKGVNFAFPSFILFSLADKTSLCQPGDGMDSGSRQRSSQSLSIAAILSNVVILFNGRLRSILFS